MFIDYFESPLGTIEVTATENGVASLYFKEQVHAIKTNQILQQVKQQVAEYFSGQRKSFDLALDVKGTQFQQAVWQQLLTIKFGESCSYSDIAKTIQNPKAVRAVGAANGKNPVSIIVPCHRVIGRNGNLTGYAGGLKRKEWLLQHESSHHI